MNVNTEQHIFKTRLQETRNLKKIHIFFSFTVIILYNNILRPRKTIIYIYVIRVYNRYLPIRVSRACTYLSYYRTTVKFPNRTICDRCVLLINVSYLWTNRKTNVFSGMYCKIQKYPPTNNTKSKVIGSYTV